MNPFATATELLADLRAGRVTSSELTEMYIGRIEQHDKRLNAVVARDFDRAREQGRAADRGGGGALRPGGAEARGADDEPEESARPQPGCGQTVAASVIVRLQ